MAFTAVAVLATSAGATAVGVSVFTAITYVGISMAVVGSLTGDKQLLKTGGMMSIMGGIGGAAEGAGLLGATGSTAAGGATAGTATTGAAGATGDAAAAGAGADAAAAGANTATANGATDFMGDYGSAGTTGASGASSGVDAAATMPSTAPAMTDPSAALSTPATGTIPDTTSVTQGASDSLAGAQSGTIGPSGVSDVGQAFTTNANGATDFMGNYGKMDSNSFFNGVGQVWDNLGPQGKSAAIQFAGGMMSGANNTAMWNEKMDLENRRLGQTSYGSATATYNKPGIINSAKA